MSKTTSSQSDSSIGSWELGLLEAVPESNLKLFLLLLDLSIASCLHLFKSPALGGSPSVFSFFVWMLQTYLDLISGSGEWK